MPFEALGEDVLLKTLAMCDIYTALTISMVNKRLRQVALVKQLWLSLLRDLGFRGILDLPPEQELENYSTGDIVDQVKRVVVGPAAWLEGFDHGASSQSRTMLHRRLCFDSVPDAQDLIDFHLLPGGRYMVIRTRVALHVSDFASGLRIWSYAARLDETRWAVDLLPGGTILHVLVLTTYYLAPDTPHISVHEVDLTSTQCSEVFRYSSSSMGRNGWGPSILGDFLVFRQPCCPKDTIFLIVNWREETYLVLNYAGQSVSNVLAVLIPGHIVVTYADAAAPHQLILTITAFTSLAAHWKPLYELSLDNQLHSAQIPFTVHERLQYERRPFCDIISALKLAAFASPLVRDTYKIIVHASEQYIRTVPAQSRAARVRRILRLGPPTTTLQPEARGALLSYRFALRSATSHDTEKACRCLLTPTSAVPAILGSVYPSLSYAGYFANNRGYSIEVGWRPDPVYEILDARTRGLVDPTDARTVLKRESGWDCMRLSVTGAVLVRKGSSIMVLYYK
ncbi:hypothetical protein B0H13DRAFT_529865 [Mycena leptocephala]|nr:hypothetical protein B0H13DRAFT_529865 [Mycena leptocephala]